MGTPENPHHNQPHVAAHISLPSGKELDVVSFVNDWEPGLVVARPIVRDPNILIDCTNCGFDRVQVFGHNKIFGDYVHCQTYCGDCEHEQNPIIRTSKLQEYEIHAGLADKSMEDDLKVLSQANFAADMEVLFVGLKDDRILPEDIDASSIPALYEEPKAYELATRGVWSRLQAQRVDRLYSAALAPIDPNDTPRTESA